MGAEVPLVSHGFEKDERLRARRAIISERPYGAHHFDFGTVGAAPGHVQIAKRALCTGDYLFGCPSKLCEIDLGQIAGCDVAAQNGNVAQLGAPSERCRCNPGHAGTGKEIGNDFTAAA